MQTGGCVTSSGDYYNLLFNCGTGTWFLPSLRSTQEYFEPFPGVICGGNPCYIERTRSVSEWGWTTAGSGDASSLVITSWSTWSAPIIGTPGNDPRLSFAQGTWSVSAQQTQQSETPEPGTFGLLGLSALGALVVARPLRRRTSRG